MGASIAFPSSLLRNRLDLLSQLAAIRNSRQYPRLASALSHRMQLVPGNVACRMDFRFHWPKARTLIHPNDRLPTGLDASPRLFRKELGPSKIAEIPPCPNRTGLKRRYARSDQRTQCHRFASGKRSFQTQAITGWNSPGKTLGSDGGI